MKKESTVTFADDFVERTVENPVSIGELLKRDFIKYVNEKKGYTYIIDKNLDDN